MARDRVYFVSDLHLGAPDAARSKVREQHFVQWLNSVEDTAKEIILLGDVFDFWHEWKHVVPRGYVRILGKLAQLTDSGVKIRYFMGNHDLWLRDYFPTELGITIHEKPEKEEWHGKTYYFAHGDGLGPGDHAYKFIRKVFTNPVCKWFFARLHPNFGIGLANFFSRSSRKRTGHLDEEDYGENEFLLIYSKEVVAENPDVDFCVFGHRHKPQANDLGNGRIYFNLGDWITHFTFLEIGPEGPVLQRFPLDGVPVPFHDASPEPA